MLDADVDPERAAELIQRQMICGNSLPAQNERQRRQFVIECWVAICGHQRMPLRIGGRGARLEGVADHYADGTYRWWHLSRPSPELVAALGDGWLPGSGRALDVGCGVGAEAGHLAAAGWQVAGIDLSQTALARAAAIHGHVGFVRTDLRWLPFAGRCFDAAVDRGCFHYLAVGERQRYSSELRRVLRPGGKLLLRASLRAAGVRNDLDEAVLGHTFTGWRIEQMQRASVPSDTRMLEVIVARLSAR